jgi:tRNA G18 (ribose-2'-O)-methylase SpoU
MTAQPPTPGDRTEDDPGDRPGDGAARVVGVGPWPGGPDAWPRLPSGGLDPRYDPELLADGDTRNVVDAYRYWTVEAIVADLDRRRAEHPATQLHVAVENWAHDLNIGSVVRTANAFNAASVRIVGRRRWNRRGAMVTDRYLHVEHDPDAASLAAWAATAGPPGDDGAPTRLPVVGVDNVPGSVALEGLALPASCVLLLGQESAGLSASAQAVCDVVVHVTQHGSTRSLNAGAAAAVAMWAWAVQHL